jgi:hypothetical protein
VRDYEQRIDVSYATILVATGGNLHRSSVSFQAAAKADRHQAVTQYPTLRHHAVTTLG